MLSEEVTVTNSCIHLNWHSPFFIEYSIYVDILYFGPYNG